jgi:urease accessory protein
MPAAARRTTMAENAARRSPLTPALSPQAGRGSDPSCEPLGGEGARPGALYRLLAWLSPGFPIGAYSYSHGIEAAAESGTVGDHASLQAWIGAVVGQGSGRIDADLLCGAHRAAAAGDVAGLAAVNRRALAYRATAELALESAAQGEAFIAACRAAWPTPLFDRWPAAGERVSYPVVFGAVAARAGVPLAEALLGYLEALVANLVSAGLRLGIIGQNDGQRILAALEPAVIAAGAAAIDRGPDEFGAASFAVDLASMAHEVQYTRLFRS